MTTHWWRRRALVLQAAVCAGFVRAALRTGSLPFAVASARAVGSLCRTRATLAECVAAGTTAADAIAHPTCLYRALTIYALVAARQPSARFHVGAAHAGLLAAHAWTSVGGHPLDGEAQRYTMLWTAPAEG